MVRRSDFSFESPKTSGVLRSLSEFGKREYIRQLLAKAAKNSQRAVVEAALAEEFGDFFPD